jgi:GDPmannose 4,6-dehydratase
MTKAIITGVTGQDGSHLADLLLEKKYEVIGVARRCSVDTTERIKHLSSNNKFKLIEGDITDVSSVINIFKYNDNVDEVYNLAAQSHVGTSFKQPALTWDITGKGCLNLLQSLVDLDMLNVKFYQASSSEMFGSNFDTDKNGVKYQDEETKFMPNSPYAIAKCAAHHAVRIYRDAYGLHASSGILFNHEGPRRGENFVTQKIVSWIANFKKWLAYTSLDGFPVDFTDDSIVIHRESFPKLRLGNIKASRDWGYAGDYVKAMWKMLQQDKAEDFVICTGKTFTIEDFLHEAFTYAGIKDWNKFIVIDKEFYRPCEVDYLKGDCSKAKRVLGWTPNYNLQGLVKMMLDAKL